MDDIYNNIEENNLNKKRKILIVFDDIIVDMISNKKLHPIPNQHTTSRGRPMKVS